MSRTFSRREFFLVSGATALETGFVLSAQAPPSAGGDTPRILAGFSYGKGITFFNPAGLFVQVGQTVQFGGIGRRGVVAYHPSIDNHELRIPENAQPFDSRKLPANDGMVQWKFDVEGTYDFYSPPAEYLGMVGRIVVGKPGGPGEKAPGYGNRDGRNVMYPDAARMLAYLKSDDIVRRKTIPCPMDLLERKFPWR